MVERLSGTVTFLVTDVESIDAGPVTVGLVRGECAETGDRDGVSVIAS